MPFLVLATVLPYSPFPLHVFALCALGRLLRGRVPYVAKTDHNKGKWEGNLNRTKFGELTEFSGP